METLITKYATAEELAHVEATRTAIADREAEAKRVGEVLADTGALVQQARNRAPVWHARAAALALGEKVEPLPAGPTLLELEEQQRGLAQRHSAALERLAAAQGKARAAWKDLLEACARRCMQDYVAATEKQAWCHQQIAAAQLVAGQAVRLVDEMVWNKYSVPGSDYLFKNLTRVENGAPILASADRGSLVVPAVVSALKP